VLRYILVDQVIPSSDIARSSLLQAQCSFVEIANWSLRALGDLMNSTIECFLFIFSIFRGETMQ
jgi:hypothetical protein